MSKLYLLRRIVEISFFLVLYSLGSIYRWVVQVLSGRGPAIGPPIGEPLAALCESLGPTFIKIGQILSSRPDLLPPEVTLPLSRLQDRVALVGAGKIERQIEKSFGRPIAEIFEFFDPVPVSGASVAQVHRARLRTGEEVAVKIRRPHVIATVKRDLLVLDFFIRVAELIPAMRLIPVRELFGEFGRLIEQQLDFDFETNNNRRFRQNFADWKQVVIPRLIDEFCTESILTMEYLDGLMKVTALTFSPEQCQEAAVFSLHALYKMIFEDGFVHGDMHPGNIFFRQGGEFVLLDLGLVAILEPRELEEFARFFFGMVSNNGKECARVVYDTAAFNLPNFDRQAFDAAMIKLVARHSSKLARDFEVTEFAVELFDTQRRHGLKGSTKFTSVILSLVLFEGIAKQICPDLDFQEQARRFIPSVMSHLVLPFSLVWWDKVIDSWNLSSHKETLAGMGAISFQVLGEDLEPVCVEWDDAGYSRRKNEPALNSPCLSATISDWQAFVNGEFAAVLGVYYGKIKYEGEFNRISPYLSGFNHLAAIAHHILP